MSDSHRSHDAACKPFRDSRNAAATASAVVFAINEESFDYKRPPYRKRIRWHRL